jgi:membrane-associated phospholipid phosphatase
MVELDWKTRLAIGIAFLIFHMGGYALVALVPHYAVLDGSIWLDRLIPFAPWWVVIYTLGNVFYLVPFVLVRDSWRFTRMAIGFFAVVTIAFLVFVAVPLEVKTDLIYGPDAVSQYVDGLHHRDTPFNSFPSLHVTLTVFAWLIILLESRRLGLWTAPLALGIVVSVLFVKQHVVIDLVAGLVLGALAYIWVTHPKGRFGVSRLERAMHVLFKF